MCAYAISTKISLITMHVWVQSGGQGVRTPPPPPPLKITKIGFLSNSGPDHQKNHEATEPAFNVWPSSARQRNAILMAFRWRADGGPLILVFRSSHQSSTRKKIDKNFWIRACNAQLFGSMRTMYNCAIIRPDSWLSLVIANCKVVTFPLISWIGRGA